MNRRELVRDVVLAGSALLVSPSFARAAQDPTRPLVDAAFKARDAGDYARMQALLERAIHAGRQDEGVLRSYAWALCRLGRGVEAVPVAQKNYRVNPGAWSLAGLCETYTALGRFEDARESLRYALRYEHEWGQARPIFEMTLEQAAPKVCTLIYEINPKLVDQFPYLKNKTGTILCPLVSDDRPFQTATVEVSGASGTTEVTVGEARALRLTPNGSSPITVTSRVQLTPTSLRDRVRPLAESPLPAAVERYLKPTSGVESDRGEVRALASPLAGKDSTQTFENIAAWAAAHLKYDGVSNDNGGGTLAVLRRGCGHCEGQTSGVVGLLRAAGIPARFVRGHGAITGKQGVPTMHTWTELYLPGAGWIPWDFNNPTFTAPVRICVGQFRYDSPFDAKDAGRQATIDLWNFQALLFPPGTTHGKNGNARFTLDVSRSF